MAVPEPCLDSFVFLRVKERQENILVEPETDDQRCIFFQFLFICFYLSPLGGSVASCRSILRSIICMDTKGMMLHCPFCQRVRCGPWRGLSASHALSNYRTTCLKWSCTVNLNVKVSKQWVCLSRYCPLKQRSANSFLLILCKQLLCSDIWIYF